MPLNISILEGVLSTVGLITTTVVLMTTTVVLMTTTVVLMTVTVVFVTTLLTESTIYDSAKMSLSRK